VAETLGAGPHLDFNAFMDACDIDADKHGVKLTAKRKKLLQSELCDISEDALPVLKKAHKPGKATPDPIHGLFEAEVNGKICGRVRADTPCAKRAGAAAGSRRH
jgi:type I restriction enzyme M protein